LFCSDHPRSMGVAQCCHSPAKADEETNLVEFDAASISQEYCGPDLESIQSVATAASASDAAAKPDRSPPEQLAESEEAMEELRAELVMEGMASLCVQSPTANKRPSQRPSEGRAPSKQKPAFSGKWQMVRHDGEFDAFMKEMGVGWAFRKAAQAVGYGVNHTFHTITQAGNKFGVVTQNPKGIFEKQFLINGEEQPDEDPMDKKKIIIMPSWDGDVIHIEARMADPPMARMPVTRRYMQGEEMVMEQTSPKGVIVRRYFARQ